MNSNLMYNAIDTDKELYDILSKFSDDMIRDIVIESLNYKFRPFGNRMANLPFTIRIQFSDIKNRSNPSSSEIILAKESSIYSDIINYICQGFNLEVNGALLQDLPIESLYSLSYVMYQIFVSEFTERMISFFSNFIIDNRDNLLNAIPDDKKNDKKSLYSKKVYSDPKVIAMYENMDTVIDIVAGLDFPMAKLIEHLSNKTTSKFICTYISDKADLYKNNYAIYLMDRISRTDIASSIKIKFMESVKNAMLIDPVNNNPYIN